MNGRARGTEWFNRQRRTARIIGPLLLFVMLWTPSVLAQEPEETPHPFPRVRNEALQQAAERVYGLLSAVKDRQLERATRILDRAQALLERIVEAAESRARRGYDIAATREAIADAREAIDAARETIRDLSADDYVLDSATDATIRSRLLAVREQLAEDLGIIRQAVHSALRAVRHAAFELRQSKPADA